MNQGLLLIPYNLIQYLLLGFRGRFFSLTLHQYEIKRGQLYLDLYLNIISSEELDPFIFIFWMTF